MAKRKISKKTNKPINIYDWAGMLDKSGEAFDKAFSKDNAFNSVSGIAGTATSILGAAQDNAKIADTSQLEGNINNAKNYVVSASDNDSLMSEWGSWSPMDNVNWKDIRGGSTGQRLTNTIGALGSGISTGVKVGGPIGGIVGGVAGLGSAIAGWISGGAKAKRKARNLNNEIAYANEHNLLSLENKANAIDNQNDLLMMANFAASGGPLDNPYKETKSLNDYIAEKADSVRMAALNKSRNRNTLVTPYIQNPESKEEFEERKNKERLGSYASTLEDLDYAYMIGDHEMAGILEQLREEKEDSYIKGEDYYKYLKEDYNPLIAGWNCMYNAGDCYGLKIPSTQVFAKEHAKHGFKKVNKDNIKPGDLVQQTDGGIPVHAMIYDSTNEQGIPLYNYSKGDTLPEGYTLADDAPYEEYYVRKGRFPMKEEPQVYRFVGTPKDSLNWTKEYNKMYNKKDMGGSLFTNGIITIDNGGTHEENPNDGVQIGVDPQGIPNLVEEGEVIWNDYVFSNRLKPTKEFKEEYKVKGETFADVAKNIQKESEERPNDPISKKGLEDSMMKLMMEQENMRSKKVKNKSKNIYAEGDWLRYAPVVGSALGVVENMFSKPTYSNARMIEDAANKAGTYTPISYTPIGNYLDYKPLDKGYHLNKLNAQAGATRRAIVNQSAGNRATAMAGLLAADYNAQGKYGDLMRQAEEFDLAQRQQVENFNRATNMTNAQMALQAVSTNQRAQQAANEMRLKGITQAASVRDKIDASRASARSANLTTLFDNLGNVGIDNANRDAIDFLIESGAISRLPEKPSWWTPEKWNAYINKHKACGGKIKKSKKGLTY